MKKEIAEIANLCSIIEDQILQKRIQGSMEWYMNKAVVNRTRFYVFSFMTIIMPLLTTMINAWEGIPETGVKNIVSLSSMLTALAASSLCLLKCQEKWVLYRSTVEKMKKLLSLYRTGEIGKDKFSELMRELEDCMDEERKKWREMREMQKDNADSSEKEDNGNENI